MATFIGVVKTSREKSTYYANKITVTVPTNEKKAIVTIENKSIVLNLDDLECLEDFISTACTILKGNEP